MKIHDLYLKGKFEFFIGVWDPKYLVSTFIKLKIRKKCMIGGRDRETSFKIQGE